MNLRFAGAAIAAAVLLQLLSFPAAASEALPYVGSWSNGRGETLVITARTLQFNDDDAVPYRDVTRGTDGSAFQLQITVKGEVNGLGGKFLGVTIEDDSMKLIAYRSHDDYMREANPQAVVTWFKDGDAEANNGE